MTTKNAAETPRKLNMEEKRKLEKMLLSDIEAGINALTDKRRVRRDNLATDLVRKPHAKASAALRRYVNAREEADRAEQELHTMGFRVESRTDGGSLGINYHGVMPEALDQFDADTRKKQQALEGLKRTYTLKLFAGGAEAQELFEALGKELKGIIS